MLCTLQYSKAKVVLGIPDELPICFLENLGLEQGLNREAPLRMHLKLGDSFNELKGIGNGIRNVKGGTVPDKTSILTGKITQDQREHMAHVSACVQGWS